IRQLNLYNFSKLNRSYHRKNSISESEKLIEPKEFANKFFIRGKPDLLKYISRKNNSNSMEVETKKLRRRRSKLGEKLGETESAERYRCNSLNNKISDDGEDSNIKGSDAATAGNLRCEMNAVKGCISELKDNTVDGCMNELKQDTLKGSMNELKQSTLEVSMNELKQSTLEGSMNELKQNTVNKERLEASILEVLKTYYLLRLEGELYDGCGYSAQGTTCIGAFKFDSTSNDIKNDVNKV
ncbi:hypothetical protein HDU92_007717, partial [Lobulomyces angularis]